MKRQHFFLVLLCFLLPVVTFAQSKKKIYNNLLLECVTLEKENDSILTICLHNDKEFKANFNSYSKLCSTISNYALRAETVQKKFEKTVDDHNQIIDFFQLKNRDQIVLAQPEAIAVPTDQYISKFMRSQVPAVPDKIQLNEKKGYVEKNAALAAYKDSLLIWRQEALRYDEALLKEADVLAIKTGELHNLEKWYIHFMKQTDNARLSVIDGIHSMVTELNKSALERKIPVHLQDYFFVQDIENNRESQIKNEAAAEEEGLEPPTEVLLKSEPISSDENTVYQVVDELPEFPGGVAALKIYLEENLKYPESAKKARIEGKAYLQFIVSKKGNISNVKVMRGIMDCPECDAEAVRVVKAMPQWMPGKIQGKVVNSVYHLPVKFQLPK